MQTAIDSLFDSVADPDLWPTAIERVLDCFDADSGILQMRSPSFVTPDVFAIPSRIDPDALDQYMEHYWQYDLWTQGAESAGLQRGDVTPGRGLFDPSDFEKGIFYQEFLKKQDIRHMFCGIADRTADDVINITVYRSERRGSFEQGGAATMHALLPAMRAAARARLRLEHSQTTANALEAMLDHIAQPVCLVDFHGKLVRANAAAEGLLAGQSDLTTAGRRLAARCKSETRAIRRAIQAAATPGQAPDPVVIHDHLGRPAHVLTAVPLRTAERARREPRRADHPVAGVFLAPARSAPPAPEDVLARLYGLTPAEARLAAVLAAGETLRSAADRLGVTYATARTQLKAVFSKTETRRQTDLVALVLSLGVQTPL